MAIRVTPLNQRRWQLFRQNKRGFWSFWLFMVLFVIAAVTLLGPFDHTLCCLCLLFNAVCVCVWD